MPELQDFRYVLDVLSLPTAAQMQAALPAGMRAAVVVVMLSAGDPASLAARRAAVAAVRAAGRPVTPTPTWITTVASPARPRAPR